MIVETAPAKVNLYLHIGPVREDSLHELASLFVFTEDGDNVSVAPAGNLSLKVAGPFAPALAGLPVEDNLVLRAAMQLRSVCKISAGAAITLEKNLPIAAGIGGGSADAAAVLRALVKLWNVDISEAALVELAFGLGADIPACLSGAPVNVGGAGEQMTKGPVLPALWICLVNPGVETPTGPIFRAFDNANSAPPAPAFTSLPSKDYGALKTALENTRNDLQPYALEGAPVIAEVLEELADAPGALTARMSGSGATCFALFASEADARCVEESVRAKGWWTMASRLRAR